MKINLENNINDFQNARRLRMILEHFSQSDIVDNNTLSLIRTLVDQINTYLANPEFARFSQSFENDESEIVTESDGVNIFGKIYSCWRSLTGPTRRELILSSQRHELIERAERAESIAFEAIAETTEVGRQRDEAIKKLQEFEKSRQSD